jgi:glycosyltransferase involved in cell wall biosynthesis
LRIAYVITRSNEVGGAHIHVRDMARWMQSNGHDVCVFCGGQGLFTELLNDANIPFYSLKLLKRPITLIQDLRAIGELATSLGQFEPNLVSLHSAKAGLLGRIACRKLNAAIIFTAHGWAFAKGVSQPARLIYLLLERWTARLADKIITVCETDRQYALKHRVGKKDQLVAINNGMPGIPDNLVANPVNGIARIVMVARFERQKDHSTVIKALSGLKDLNWVLDLVGDGPLLEDIKGMVDNSNLGDKVNFLGRRSDVAEILSKSDIFLLASFWEGFPRSILEAMRASLPVIASRVAGVPEAVEEASTGFLVEPGNVDQIRVCLQRLIEDKELRKKMGCNGHDKYEKQFTFETMASKTLDIYASMV